MSQIIEVLRESDPEAAVTLECIALEYMRRRHDELCTTEMDDKLTGCELSIAAQDYLHWEADQARPGSHTALTQVPTDWPFANQDWKPRSLRFALIAAGTYMLAELTRLVRAGK